MSTMSSLGTPAPWPMAQHDPQNTGRSGFFGPTELTVWKQIPLPVISGIVEPVIDMHGNVYLGLNNKTDLLCIASDGSTKWTYTPPSYTVLGIQATSAIGPDGTVYMADAMIHAVTPDGKQKWDRDLRTISGIDTIKSIGMPLKLSADGTTLYFSANVNYREVPAKAPQDVLFALNASDGSDKWHRIFGGTGCIPGIGPDGTVYTGCYVNSTIGDALYAFNASDGLDKWEHPLSLAECPEELKALLGLDLLSIRRSITVDDRGNIYFCSISQYKCVLVCLNPSGSYKWHYTDSPREGSEVHYNSGMAPNGAIALAKDGTIYVGFEEMHAVTPDGKKKWTTNFDPPIRLGEIRRPPSHALVDQDGSVYFGTSNGVSGKIYGYSPTGSQLWAHEITGITNGLTLSANASLCFVLTDSNYQGGGNYQGGARSTLNIITGPLSVIQNVEYSGRTLTVELTGLTQDVTGYTIGVFAGNALVTSKDSDTTSTSLDIVLDPTQTYEVKIQAHSNAGSSPWSAGVPIIEQVPDGLELHYNQNQTAFEMVWDAVSDPHVTGYTAQLEKNGSVAESKKIAHTTVTFNDTFQDDVIYQARVRATGDRTTGPFNSTSWFLSSPTDE